LNFYQKNIQKKERFKMSLFTLLQTATDATMSKAVCLIESDATNQKLSELIKEVGLADVLDALRVHCELDDWRSGAGVISDVLANAEELLPATDVISEVLLPTA
jgi:hypothetical protein